MRPEPRQLKLLTQTPASLPPYRRWPTVARGAPASSPSRTGNPLALVEPPRVPVALDATTDAVLPLTARLERSFTEQARGLPETTRALLRTAAPPRPHARRRAAGRHRRGHRARPRRRRERRAARPRRRPRPLPPSADALGDPPLRHRRPAPRRARGVRRAARDRPPPPRLASRPRRSGPTTRSPPTSTRPPTTRAGRRPDGGRPRAGTRSKLSTRPAEAIPRLLGAAELADELGPKGIRVNTVSPGPVSTGLWLGTGGVAATVAARGGVSASDVAARGADRALHRARGGRRPRRAPGQRPGGERDRLGLRDRRRAGDDALTRRPAGALTTQRSVVY